MSKLTDEIKSYFNNDYFEAAYSTPIDKILQGVDIHASTINFDLTLRPKNNHAIDVLRALKPKPDNINELGITLNCSLTLNNDVIILPKKPFNNLHGMLNVEVNPIVPAQKTLYSTSLFSSLSINKQQGIRQSREDMQIFITKLYDDLKDMVIRKQRYSYVKKLINSLKNDGSIAEGTIKQSSSKQDISFVTSGSPIKFDIATRHEKTSLTISFEDDELRHIKNIIEAIN
ncbi:hypothetical protein [Photobacterium kishitanii]|uniref:Uncharacterized protein n=1 Tax=Photobacterium kishitanii TaxID=318456 RepID=A0A2T3KLN9_9GAMM|nr:hypothetical protein [Photobacterium kishitanii]PSV00635.1 hypothetical protein C9J27_05720 [Photobacterium kishitanii]